MDHLLPTCEDVGMDLKVASDVVAYPLVPSPHKKGNNLIPPHSNTWYRSGFHDILIYDLPPLDLIQPDRKGLSSSRLQKNKLTYSVEISCPSLVLFEGNGLPQKGSASDGAASEAAARRLVDVKLEGFLSTTSPLLDCETQRNLRMYRAEAKSGIKPDGLFSK